GWIRRKGSHQRKAGNDPKGGDLDMDNNQRNRLRAEGQRIEATVHVGKGGVSTGIVAELDAQLKRNHLVKVRLQRGAAGGERTGEVGMAQELAEALGAEIVERRGHTVLIYRRKKVA
ncbi:MAG: YhbY family RNA-binding protein, partial [Planctomycetes bacterium]|nr:YhbY family RNA-binding protein [Planctomycetota bacterium]